LSILSIYRKYHTERSYYSSLRKNYTQILSKSQYKQPEYAKMYQNRLNECDFMDCIKRIRALREDKDLTQEQLASVLKRSQQGYAHIENYKAKLSIEDLQTLCKFYDVSADYILGFTDIKKPLPKK